MKLSTTFKIIFGFLLVLLVAVISSVYHIDFSNYLSNVNNKLANDSRETKKIKVDLVKCIDGDTAKFKENGKTYTYRFLGINTPEVINKIEPYGREASNYTCSKLMNAKNIYITYEKTSTHIDKYDRRLVWVYIDNILLQESLIKEGYASVSYVYANLTHLSKLYKKEDIAKENKLGIYENYSKKTYNDKTYTVIFKNGNIKDEVNIKAGKKVNIINDPKLDGYLFAGWTLNGELFDLSKEITSDVILEASFVKNT